MKMREIADAAGVSLTAVSLVLNGKPGIGDEKRALVTRLLQENGYQIRPEDAPQRIHAHSNLCFLKYSKHSYLVNGNPGFVTHLTHRAAFSGLMVARSLNPFSTRRPEQYGQPPPDTRS